MVGVSGLRLESFGAALRWTDDDSCFKERPLVSLEVVARTLPGTEALGDIVGLSGIGFECSVMAW